MRITEQQLFDYIECPAKYHIKYNMKIDIPEEVHLSKLLNSVSNFFYLNLHLKATNLFTKSALNPLTV